MRRRARHAASASAASANASSSPSSGGGRRRQPPDYDPADEVKYRALFAILTRLLAEEQQEQQQLEQQQQQQGQQPSRLAAFARAQPAALGVPFLCWLADLEASPSSPSAPPRPQSRPALARLCERLVALREAQEREAGERLYDATLRALGGGDPGRAALVASDPRAYQAALSLALTGEAPPGAEGDGDDEDGEDGDVLAAEGRDEEAEAARPPATSRLSFGRLLRAAPPAALTPAGVAAGLAAAEELAGEARQRRRSSLAAIAGRAPLTAEAEASLLAGSVASRILDLLLGLPTAEARLALLPDCFAPPPPPPPPPPSEPFGGGGGGGGGGGQADDGRRGEQQGRGGDGADEQGQEEEEEQETEELWCTPLQLLVEVEARLRAAEGGGGGQTAAAGVGLFGGANGGGGVAGTAATFGGGGAGGGRAIGSGGGGGGGAAGAPVDALRELRASIRASWMDALPGGRPGGA